jgi:hypothetical protein
MSRSQKNFPGFKDKDHSHQNDANRKVRQVDVGNGGAYKKVYEQYRISDYNFRYYSRKDLLEHVEKWYSNKNKEKIRKFYKALSK